MTMPEVIVIRGAPGSGKSEAAKRLAARLGTGARVEVDTLRAMIVAIDWTNQSEHINVLSLATSLVAGFLELGHRPVIVVDTFSGDKLTRFLDDLRVLRDAVSVRIFALVPSIDVLRARVAARPQGHFKDLGICERLNREVLENLEPGECVIDNSELSAEATVDAILDRVLEASMGAVTGQSM